MDTRSPKIPTLESTNNIFPTQVIDNILSRLPLEDAARASAVSRQWRYRWLSIPNLIFDSTFHRKRNLDTIIYRILLRHRGPIRKFLLHVPTFKSRPDLDQWIYLLLNCQVEELTLNFCWGEKYTLPPHFFGFENLRHLDLFGCLFEPPPDFEGFRNLVTLNFQEVKVVPEVLERVVSHCPNLESLRVVDCTDWDLFEVEGPCLRSFTFHGIFKSITFKNCAVLNEVSLSAPLFGDSLAGWRESIRYFEFLPTLEKLHLSLRVLELLGAGDVPNQLPPHSLTNLTYLNLQMYLDSIDEVVCALCLIRNAQNLETLKLSLYAGVLVDEVAEFIRGQEAPDPDLFQLKRVEVAVFSGVESQMELLRYILASAIGLEEMVINSPTFSRPRDVDLVVMNQLMESPRMSPNCRIVFQ